MTLPFYVYDGGPLDIFYGTISKGEMISDLKEAEAQNSPDADIIADALNGFDYVEAYMQLFTDNILRCPIVAFAIPGDYSMQYCYIAKLDNNGVTYIFTPMQMNYLLDIDYTLVYQPEY